MMMTKMISQMNKGRFKDLFVCSKALFIKSLTDDINLLQRLNKITAKTKTFG